MKTLILFALLTIFISACGSPFRPIVKNEVFYNKHISFQVPMNGFEIDKDENNDYKYISNVYSVDSDFTISINSIDYHITDDLFDKKSDYEATARRESQSEYIKNRNEEQNITYDKTETQYIQGMKCYGTVFSRSYGGSAYDATSKNYSITCGYYDTQELKNDGKRALRIDYRYAYANPDNTRLEKDRNLKASQIPTSQVIENNLKQHVKDIIRTIKIKNFDRARMEQAGLLHDNAFESTKW